MVARVEPEKPLITKRLLYRTFSKPATILDIV